MSLTAKLTVGAVVQYDGGQWTVTGFAGGKIQLRNQNGSLALLDIGVVTGSPDFKVQEREKEEPADQIVTFLNNVPVAAITKAEELLAHLNEVECGYRSGSKDAALAHEPRPEYDPEDTTLNGRIAAKSKELGVATRTLWRLKESYLVSGIYGLVDQRQVREGKSQIDPRVEQALRSVLAAQRDKSTVTQKTVIARTKTKIYEDHPNEKIALPSEPAFYRLIKRLTKGTEAFGSAKARRNNDNRPKETYRKQEVVRPGEFVLIDSTPFDAFAMDPLTFKWVQIQLTIALDLFTRSIVGWRFTPVGTKAVDAALLLYDIIRPKLMQPGWPQAARWPYIGVPESIIVKLVDDDATYGIAGVPLLYPETLVVDHGKIFISRAFRDACIRLGINMQLARVYTPTDKAQVERVFKTIRENFVEHLPGYKGPDVYSRGLDPEGDAFYFIDEIDARFACWVASRYQIKPHEGLALAGIPLLAISPNDAYNEGIARAGFMHVVASELMYYELLPTEWRTVQNYGVEARGLRYNGDILGDYRNRESPYSGIYAGKWPIRYDPRDLSRAFFFDKYSNRWHELRWVHDAGEGLPFNEATLGFAKALLISRGGNPRNIDELAETLNSLLLRMLTPTEKDRRERRLAAVNAMHAQQVKQDRPAAANEDDDRPDAEFEMAVAGPIQGARTTVAPDDAGGNTDIVPLRSIEEAMEDDDDDMGF